MQSHPQHTSIDMQPYGHNAPITAAPPPRDFVLWSLFNLVWCNPCCLGLCALSYSIKSRDRIIAQDLTGAGIYGKKAKVLNIVALFWGICVTITSIVLVIVLWPRSTERP